MAPKTTGGSKPDPPKRPLAPFFLFKQDVYEVTKKENPSMQICDLTKVIAEKWKLVDAAGKVKYEKLQAEGKKRYDKEKKDYEATYGPIQKKTKTKQKAAKEEAKKQSSQK